MTVSRTSLSGAAGSPPVLSVIIPVYNERATLPEILTRVLNVPIEKEILIVDDGSTDGIHAWLATIVDERVRVLRHDSNRGKGSAIRTALPYARGRYVMIQDADLEYDPRDYMSLIDAAKGGEVVVYGSRNLHRANRISYRRYWLGGILLSRLANLLYGLRITDEATGYKLFARDLIQSVPLTCTGFEFCAEITAKLGKRKIRIKEVPIRYQPRSFREGKKMRWHDGVMAVWTLLKYRFGGDSGHR